MTTPGHTRLRVTRAGIDTYQQPVVYMHRDCEVCRSEGFVAMTRVRLAVGTRTLVTTLNVVVDARLGLDEVALSEAAWTLLDPMPDALASVRHAEPASSAGALRAKVFGARLDDTQYLALVQDVMESRLSDLELAAFVTASAGDRLDHAETTALTRAMIAVGQRLDWGEGPVLDKHCVGGLPGNRTTPIVVAIVAALGYRIPKTSSRAITSPAGTADTMEVMAPVALDLPAMQRVVEREGGCIVWGGNVRLSPADDILIRVQRPLDFDSDGQLVASVLSKKIDALFASFDDRPLAAASVAQIHPARMHDGRDVVVKITRPGIHAQVQADLRLLRRTMRVAQWVWPPLRRHRPLELVDELGAFLRDEIDMRHEAQNMRRMAKVLDALPGITQPHVVEPYASRDVLVQDRSHGTRLETAYGTAAAPALASALLDAYVHQLFGAGVFHADPHPGNLFFFDDGRLCLHDFGSIGVLDPASRLALGGMVEAIAADDAEGVLDAAIALGFFPPQVERRSHVREIHLILAEMASRPLAEWSIAEAIWRVARIGQGAGFRLPAHLLALIRTLFLVENTLRALDPDMDLLGTLSAQAADVMAIVDASRPARRPLAMRLARTARQLPQIATDLLRQAQLSDGRPAFSVHHHGLAPTHEALARTGNRLALALVTLGLYVSGSLLALHSTGPLLAGHLPWLSVIAFAGAALLSLRLVVAIGRSGHL